MTSSFVVVVDEFTASLVSCTPKTMPLTVGQKKLDSADRTNQLGDWQIRTINHGIA